MHQYLTPELLVQALDYAQYRAFQQQLLAEGRTTGPMGHEPKMVEFTQLNEQRMLRQDSHPSLRDDAAQAAKSLSRKLLWVVFVEPWCGDVAQNLPTLAQIVAASEGKIELRMLLRDEHRQAFDHYLTQGSESIPKLVCLDAQTQEELGTWGPRPAPAQAMVMAYKANPTVSYGEFAKEVHAWYARDRNQTLQDEFLGLLQSWS
jgi:hypothetical protein